MCANKLVILNRDTGFAALKALVEIQTLDGMSIMMVVKGLFWTSRFCQGLQDVFSGHLE